MNTKRNQKPRSPAMAKTEPAVTEQQTQPSVLYDPATHAEMLLAEAKEEANLDFLEEYVQVIGTLRNKGFSYRDIAAWLAKRGVEADHNAIYRVYMKNLTRTEAMVEGERGRMESLKKLQLDQ